MSCRLTELGSLVRLGLLTFVGEPSVTEARRSRGVPPGGCGRFAIKQLCPIWFLPPEIKVFGLMVCRCGNRECDFQAWRHLQAI